jgi:hypothetical protein
VNAYEEIGNAQKPVRSYGGVNPMPTDQMLLRLDVELLEELKTLATKYGKRSGNAVAAEIIEQYKDFWVELEEDKRELMQRQRSLLRPEVAPRPAAPKTRRAR